MVAAPPKDKKPTKDTPVSPTDAMTHIHGVVTGIQGTLAQGLGDKNNPDAFAMSQMRTIRNNGTTIAAGNLTVGEQTMGITVRGHDDAGKQKSDPTTITVDKAGEKTTFVPRRNEQGEVRFVNQATVGPAAREKGIALPQTLDDFVHAEVQKTPNAAFTKAQAHTVGTGATKLAMEAPQDQRDRIATTNLANARAGDITGIKAPPLQVESVGDAADRARQTAAAEKAKAGIGIQQGQVQPGVLEQPGAEAQRLAGIAAKTTADAAAQEQRVKGAADGGLQLESRDSADARAGQKTGWRAGTTRQRTPGLTN